MTNDERTHLLEQVERLKAALKPFADAAEDVLGDYLADDDHYASLFYDGGPTVADFRQKKVLSGAASAARKLAGLRPETPALGECGDQSRLYYEKLAEALEDWSKKL